MGKRFNELSGSDWLRYSVSIWSDISKGDIDKGLGHPAVFPKALVDRVMDIYLTEEQRVVLDPFVGVGNVVFSAMERGKIGIGFDVVEEYINVVRDRVNRARDLFIMGDVVLYCADARELDKYISEGSVDFCMTSPPYWDILGRRRSADLKEKRDYIVDSRNIGLIRDYDEFLSQVGVVFEKVYKVLKCDSYCIVVVMDIRKGSKFYAYHIDIVKLLEGVGFELEDIVIWDRRREYNNLKPLGYPYQFRVNKVHEYILIFKKKGKEV